VFTDIIKFTFYRKLLDFQQTHPQKQAVCQ